MQPTVPPSTQQPPAPPPPPPLPQSQPQWKPPPQAAQAAQAAQRVHAVPHALGKPVRAATGGVRRPLDFGPLSVALPEPEPAHDPQAPFIQPWPQPWPAPLPAPTHHAAPMPRAAAASASLTESKPAARRQRAVWRRAPIPMDFEIPSVPSPTGRRPP